MQNNVLCYQKWAFNVTLTLHHDNKIINFSFVHLIFHHKGITDIYCRVDHILWGRSSQSYVHEIISATNKFLISYIFYLLTELTVFTINHCILPEAVAGRCSLKKVFLETLQNSWETPVSESFFNKVSGRPKNTSFTEHLRWLFLYFSRFHARIKLVLIMKISAFRSIFYFSAHLSSDFHEMFQI